MSSPRSPLHRITWYFCLITLLALNGLVKVSADPAAPSPSLPAATVGGLSPAAARWAAKHPHKWHKPAKRKHERQKSRLTPVAVQISENAKLPVVQSAPTEPSPTVSISPAMKTAPIASAAPAPPVHRAPIAPAPQPSALDMTRDAAAPLESTPMHDAGHLDISAPLIKMLGALVLVLALILGTVRLLQKYNIVPSVPADRQATGKLAAAQKNTSFSAALLAGLNKQQLPDEANFGDSFQLLSSLNLPGSTASIHMVQASSKTLVISATQAGAVTVLTEVSNAEPAKVHTPDISSDGLSDYDDDAITAFADILREKAGLPSIGNRPDLLALDHIETRLSETQSRLKSRLTAGAELTAAAPDRPRTRRRTVKAVQPKGSDFE